MEEKKEGDQDVFLTNPNNTASPANEEQTQGESNEENNNGGLSNLVASTLNENADNVAEALLGNEEETKGEPEEEKNEEKESSQPMKLEQLSLSEQNKDVVNEMFSQTSTDRKSDAATSSTAKKPKTVSQPHVPPKSYSKTKDGEISILNFETECEDEIPTFTESFTIKALDNLAIEPKQIKKLTENDLAEYKAFPEVKAKAERVLNRRRTQLINEVCEERERLIEQSKIAKEDKDISEAEQGSRTQRLIEENEKTARQEFSRIEGLQKREIEQLIIAELVREMTIKEENERQARRDAVAAARAAEVAKKQAEDAERRKQKDAALLQRIQEKEAALLELKKKQEEEIERNQRMIQERKEKHLKQMAEAEKQRQIKAIQQREMLDKQLEEERQKIIERQKEQVKRDMILEQRRAAHYQQIKERNAAIFNKQRERFEAGQQRERELFEQKRKAMEKKEADGVERVKKIETLRMKTAQQTRARSMIQVERHQKAKTVLMQREEERIARLVNKENKSDERRAAILQVKLDRCRKERIINIEKQKKIQEEREARAAEERKKEEQYLKTLEEDEQRLKEVRQQKEEELASRIAYQRLKDQIQAENAERVKKREEVKIKQRAEVAQDREERALVYVRQRQELAEKKKLAAVQLDFKKEEVHSEFAAMMRVGGALDVEGLSRKFDIDVEELKRKVAESRNKKVVSRPETTESVTFTGYKDGGMEVAPDDEGDDHKLEEPDSGKRPSALQAGAGGGAAATLLFEENENENDNEKESPKADEEEAKKENEKEEEEAKENAE